jgi:hypothetical protein
MMVAAVAYQKLNQATKDRVDALLLLNPDRDNWLDLIPVAGSETAYASRAHLCTAHSLPFFRPRRRCRRPIE